MIRYLLYRQRLLLCAGHFTNLIGRAVRTGAHVDWYAAGEIRQIESLLAVSAIGRSDQLKEHIVLRNGECLSFAEHPAVRSEVACEHSDFTDIWFWHFLPPLSSAMGRCPGAR